MAIWREFAGCFLAFFEENWVNFSQFSVCSHLEQHRLSPKKGHSLGNTIDLI